MESAPPAASRTMEMPSAKECLIEEAGGILRVENQRGAEVRPLFEGAQADAAAEIEEFEERENRDEGGE